MSESASLGGTAEGGQGRKGQLVGRGSAPPSKKQAQPQEDAGPAGGGGTRSKTVSSGSGGGKHAYARSKLGELSAQRDGMRSGKQANELFQLPPIVTEQFGRTAQFAKRVFSAETLLDPLPAPLKTALSRNFGFFTRIFTQFTDPEGKKQIGKSFGGK